MKSSKIFKILMAAGSLVFASIFLFSHLLKKNGVIRYNDISVNSDEVCLNSVEVLKPSIRYSGGDICFKIKYPTNYVLKSGTVHIFASNQSNGSKNSLVKVSLQNVSGIIEKNGLKASFQNAKGEINNLKIYNVVGSFHESSFTIQSVSKVEQQFSLNNIAILYRDFTVFSESAELTGIDNVFLKNVTIHDKNDPILQDEYIRISKKEDRFTIESGLVKTALPRLIEIIPELKPFSISASTHESKADIFLGRSIKGHVDLNPTSLEININGECDQVVKDLAPIWEDNNEWEGLVDLTIEYRSQIKVSGQSDCHIKNPNGTFSRSSLRSKFTRTTLDVNLNQEMVKTGPEDTYWVPFSHIPRTCIEAALASEDARFYKHAGIDYDAFSQAMNANLKKKSFKRGGSTISMQTAKNLWLSRSRTATRKIAEYFLTSHLEQTLSKQEILETYFNIAEVGPGIYGIRAAADYYFDKNPETLTMEECALIVATLPSPKNGIFNEEGMVRTSKSRRLDQILSRIKKEDEEE